VIDWSGVRREALELLQGLLRIDTSNPPGREDAAAELLAESLRADKIEPEILTSSPGRTNLIARLRGSGGGEGPLLLCAHLDTVPAGDTPWKHPPFSGAEAEGYIWGRGAVDMKNMAAMSAMVAKLLVRSGAKHARDIVLAFVADEEQGCDLGSKWLVDHHADRVKAELMLGEVGGFSYDLFGRRLYPIMVAEKGLCWTRITARGTPGHGSMPREDAALARLADAIAKLGTTQLPIHRTRPVDAFLSHVCDSLPLPQKLVFPLFANSAVGRALLAKLPDRQLARSLWAMLSSTATPTILRAGEKVNVVPGIAVAEVDGRTLPGQSQADFLAEVRALIGDGFELDVLKWAPAVETDPVGPAWDAINETLRRLDPTGIPVPYLCPGFTDAKYFSTLGAQCLGFAPLRFDPTDRTTFSSLFHAPDERIPTEGYLWGLKVLYETVCRIARVP
jgi:acetylornithine deacetylase/succinyl-diaminopimelate desuccinylase-like protein